MKKLFSDKDQERRVKDILINLRSDLQRYEDLLSQEQNEKFSLSTVIHWCIRTSSEAGSVLNYIKDGV